MSSIPGTTRNVIAPHTGKCADNFGVARHVITGRDTAAPSGVIRSLMGAHSFFGDVNAQ